MDTNYQKAKELSSTVSIHKKIREALTLYNLLSSAATIDPGKKSPSSGDYVNINYINKNNLEELKREFTEKFVFLIKNHDFEFGKISPAEVLAREQMKKNALATKEWINDIFIKYFDNLQIVIGLLRVVSHFEYDEISPQGITISIASVAHKDPDVRECGIRALENWGNLECLRILKSVHCPEPWLASYLAQVIKDLEESLL